MLTYCPLVAIGGIFIVNSCFVIRLQRGWLLDKQIEKNPRAVVLLDEIVKAHTEVLIVFLQLFDDGRITDPKVCCPKSARNGID